MTQWPVRDILELQSAAVSFVCELLDVNLCTILLVDEHQGEVYQATHDGEPRALVCDAMKALVLSRAYVSVIYHASCPLCLVCADNDVGDLLLPSTGRTLRMSTAWL
jgi:hypothetical protein